MGNRKVHVLAGVVAATLIGVALVYTTRENDPVCAGKRLSEHLQALRRYGLSHGGGIENGQLLLEPRITPQPSDQQILEAISTVGTNALPMLVRMLRSKDSRIGLWIRSLLENYRFVGKWIRLKPPDAWRRRMGAVIAFYRLGPQVAPAIPEIIPLLQDPELVLTALFALMYIHPEREQDVLSLTNVLRLTSLPSNSGPASLLHSTAILALGTFETKASGAVPVLLDCLSSTNERVRATAAVALARIGAPPNKAVPGILANLSAACADLPSVPPRMMGSRPMLGMRSNTSEMMMNIWALGEYGPHASNALPVLTNLARSISGNAQQAAKDAAAKINGLANDVFH